MKSSKEVERQLKAEGNFDAFVCESVRNYDECIERDPKAKTSDALSSDGDTDYEPPEKRSVQASKDKWCFYLVVFLSVPYSESSEFYFKNS